MSPVTLACEPRGLRVAAEPGEDLLRALRRAGVPVGSSCDGDGVCGRCGLRVLSGALSPPGELELRTAARNGLAPGVRLACQAIPLGGEVVLWAPYW